MRRVLAILAVAGALVLSVVTPALAAPDPMGADNFGQFVSGMAPEHPIEHGGAMFGDCVSSHAQGAGCPMLP